MLLPYTLNLPGETQHRHVLIKQDWSASFYFEIYPSAYGHINKFSVLVQVFPILFSFSFLNNL